MYKQLISGCLFLLTALTPKQASAQVMKVLGVEGKVVAADISTYHGAKIQFVPEGIKVTINEQSTTVKSGDGAKITFTGASDSYAKQISSAGYATFTPSQDVKVPEGVTAYKVAEMGSSSVRLQSVTGNLAAGEGYLIKGDEAGYTFPGALFPTEAPTDANTNLLIGTLKGKTVAANSVLTLGRGKSTSTVGFWNYEGTTIAAGSAYLEKPSSAAPTFYSIIWDDEDATTINSLNSTPADNGTCYNLSGQRVSTNYRGIIISNGKKYLK